MNINKLLHTRLHTCGNVCSIAKMCRLSGFGGNCRRQLFSIVHFLCHISKTAGIAIKTIQVSLCELPVKP